MTGRAATTSVASVMTRAPVTVTSGTTVGELIELFERHGFNAFPVVDAEGVLSGIVTKLDALRVFHPSPTLHIPDARAVAAIHVAEIMRPGVVNVEPGDPLVTAAELMVTSRLRSLPVARRGPGKPELVGIVTQGDLLRALRAELMPQPAAAAEEES